MPIGNSIDFLVILVYLGVDFLCILYQYFFLLLHCTWFSWTQSFSFSSLRLFFSKIATMLRNSFRSIASKSLSKQFLFLMDIFLQYFACEVPTEDLLYFYSGIHFPLKLFLNINSEHFVTVNDIFMFKLDWQGISRL